MIVLLLSKRCDAKSFIQVGASSSCMERSCRNINSGCPPGEHPTKIIPHSQSLFRNIMLNWHNGFMYKEYDMHSKS